MAFSHPHCGGSHDTVAAARVCENAPAHEAVANKATIVQEATPESDNAYERMSGPLAEEGFYRVGDSYFKVQRAVHGSGRLYAKELVEVPVRVDGELVSKGRWELARGVVYRLRKKDLLSVEEAAKFGQLYGMCMYCWRELTDERSIEVGYGPTCAENRNLPWGEVG